MGNTVKKKKTKTKGFLSPTPPFLLKKKKIKKNKPSHRARRFISILLIMKKNRKGKTRIKPDIPTFEEVVKYMTEQGISEFTPRRFFSYYSSRGWMLDQGVPVGNWQDAIQSWVELEKKKARKGKADKQGCSHSGIQPTVDHIGEQLEREARQAKDAEQHVSWEEYKRMKAEGRI